jgi:hypothetical protein
MLGDLQHWKFKHGKDEEDADGIEWGIAQVIYVFCNLEYIAEAVSLVPLTSLTISVASSMKRKKPCGSPMTSPISPLALNLGIPSSASSPSR